MCEWIKGLMRLQIILNRNFKFSVLYVSSVAINKK